MALAGTSEAGRPPMGGSEAWIDLGRVSRSHGLRGALLVHLHGDDPANLNRSDRVMLSNQTGEAEFKVRSVKQSGALADGRARVRMLLKGIDCREDADVWKGATLKIPESKLMPLPDGEFYWRELLGLTCRLPDGEAIGVIEELWPTPVNDVLVIRGPRGQLLIPALRRILVRIDRQAGELWLEPLPGMLEDV